VYGALEQTVEETMEEGTAKDLAKATVPMAGILAVPAVLSLANKAISLSPTVQAGKAAAQQFGDPQNILVQDVMQDDVLNRMMRQNAPKIPGLGFIINKTQRLMANRAAEQMRQVSEELADPSRVDVQQAMKTYNDLVNFMKTDPLMQQINASDRFLLDAAQVSLYGPLLAERNKLVRELTGPALRREQLRQQNLEKMFSEAFDVLAPRAPLQFDDALRVYWADDQNAVAQAMKQIKDLSESEALGIADRFKAIDLNDIGDTLRRSIVAQMDGQFYKLRKEAEELGMRMGTTPEGVPTPVRSGFSVSPNIPAVTFDDFARKLISKYKLTPDDRLYVDSAAPAPVRMTDYYMRRFEKAIENNMQDTLDTLVRQYYLDSLTPGGTLKRLADNNPADFNAVAENPLKALRRFVDGKINEADLKKVVGTDFPTPKPKDIASIKEAARTEALKNVEFNLSLPEALDLLGSSLRYKNAAFLAYNKRLEMGMPRKDAQRVLDVGNALHRDIEEFLFKNFPRGPEMRNWMDKYEDTFKNGYEKFFPMMISKKRPTGEPYISSESVISEALKSGDNIRALRAIMGDNNPLFNKTMMDVMYDQAYRAGVVGKDGLLDTAKYNRWLSTKQNVINAMPDSVQATLKDEAVAADGVMQRLRDMQSRIDDSRDLDFDLLIKKAVRPGADTNQLIATAISDPASMRLLIDRFGKDPQNLESLRRRVWDQVRNDLYNPNNPTYLKDFLQKHGKSLNMIYEPQHLDNLRHLAEIQQRVFLGERVVGKETPFMSADEKLRKMIGSGFGTLESTVRAATIRIISPVHAGVSLLARLVSRQQHNVYEAIMYKALTDPKYAQALANSTANSNTAQGVAQMGKLLADAGYPLSTIVRPAIKIGGIEAVQATMPEDQELPVRQSPARPTLPQLPGAQAPAAPSGARPLSQSPVTQAVPSLPQQQDTQGTYEQFSRLFPNDFLSPMIQQQGQLPQP
jgi:hypothetical protein